MNSTSHRKSLQTGAVTTLLVALLAAPVVVYGAIKALQSTSNDPRQWLPRSFAETDTYDWFLDLFGSDEFAVVSWPGCKIGDSTSLQLALALEQSEFFQRAICADQILAELTDPSVGLSRAAALRRLSGLLIGPRDGTSCLVLTTSEVGQSDRPRAVAEIERLAEQVGEIAPDQLRLAGPTVDAAAIDAESRRLLFQLAGISALVSFLVASLRMGSPAMAVAVLCVAGYGTGVALALLYFSGGHMNLLMTMLPPLVYVLTISSAVHLANYFRDGMQAGLSQSAATDKAISQGWAPCSLAALTTGVGLISLATSKIEPIQMFGIYAAAGVVISVAALFLLLPAALRMLPASKRPADAPVVGSSSHRWPIVDRIDRHRRLVVVGGVAAMVICGSRIPYVESTVRLQDRFLPSSDTMADYRWLEDKIGPMVPLEVVIHIDNDDPRDQLERLQLVAAVQRKIQSLDQQVGAMSALNLSPPLPSGRSIGNVVSRKVIGSARTRQRWTDAGYLQRTDDQQLWRISVRARAVSDLDYGYFAETIRAAVTPILQEAGVEGTFTGVIPLIYKAQRQLLEDLFRSFLVAFGVIALMMVAVLRNVVAALLAMIPNLFPAIIIFGGIEWVGIPVQIGSVMTASAALGIAVDDTVHVLTWFRRGLSKGLSRLDAISDAFGRCAGAMVHTTLICSSGLIVFAFSSFVPILHFAWLMVLLLVVALIGDLILLPAILVGSLGRWFEYGRPRSD